MKRKENLNKTNSMPPKISPAARNIAVKMRANADRAVAQVTASLSRNYGGDYRSGGAKWPGGLSGDGRGYSVNHWRMRQNSRAAYHDNLLGRSIVERYVEVIAGVGLKFESSPNHEVLGISLEEAERWGADFDNRFHLWANSKTSHRSEEMTLYQAQRLYVRIQQRDGDNFLRLYYDGRRDLLNPLQFELIDCEQIVGDAWTTSHGYIASDDGIVRDAKGKAIAYKISVKQSNGTYKKETIPAVSRSGRKMMLHGYAPEYAGQSRGYSRIGHAVQELQGLTSFSLSQIMKAIYQSQIFMFVKPGKNAGASNPIEDLNNFPQGPFSAAYGSNPTPPEGASEVTDAALAPIESYNPPHANIHEPGGMAIFGLNKGEDMQPFSNTAPAERYDKFVDSFGAYLSASAGMPFEAVMMRFNANYNAARGALIMLWRNCEIWRYEMESDKLNPIKAAFTAEEIAAGRISAPGWNIPVLRAAWLDGTWHGVTLPNLDELKSAKTDKMKLEMAAKTLDGVARESGFSGSRNRAKLNRELKELPVMPWMKTTTT